MKNIHSFPFVRLAVIVFALAIGVLRAALPPEALATMNKGVLAAQQQDYPLAIRFFQDARKLAPDAPEVFYNLGLAESKIAGRELRAMAWFGAYLAAFPTASNAAAVNEQISALDVKYQSNISRFIKIVRDAASQKSKREIISTIPNDLNRNFYDVAKLLAMTGDISGALEVANLIDDAFWKNHTLAVISTEQAQSGDTSGARLTATLIQNIDIKRSAEEAAASSKATISKSEISVSTDRPAILITDWLKILDNNDVHRAYPLDTGVFLDFAKYMQSPILGVSDGYFREADGRMISVPAAENPRSVFLHLSSAVDELVTAHNFIATMLRNQTQQQRMK